MYKKTLAMMGDGEMGKVCYVRGGKRVVYHLMEMGFVENTIVKVLRSNFRGPILVEVNGSRYALGRGMAMKIIVEVIG